MYTNVAISGDRNVIKKEAEKILKFKDLIIEIQCMWNVRTKVIPVIMRATGTFRKSFTKYLMNKPGEHEIQELPVGLGSVYVSSKSTNLQMRNTQHRKYH